MRKENPADIRVLYLLSQAQRAAGRLDQAEATARELMTIAPGSLTGPYALALVLEQKQQYRQVVDDARADRRQAGGEPGRLRPRVRARCCCVSASPRSSSATSTAR